LRFFKGCRWIVWHYKNKANLGSDWGRGRATLTGELGGKG
jgi:site-specific DNA-methyltransferase (adenine-specific)